MSTWQKEDGTFKFNKLLITIWPFALHLQASNLPVGITGEC